MSNQHSRSSADPSQVRPGSSLNHTRPANPPNFLTVSMYSSPNDMRSPNDMQEPHAPKAHQACMSCRRQKRKCSKSLPACTLCERMNRHCDYSDSSPAPTAEDFNALHMKVIELESRLNGDASMINSPTPLATSSSTTLSASDSLGQPLPPYNPPQDYAWQGIQNKFPAIALLDKDTFKNGG